ncbi:MAG: hypothetical protein IPI67_21075, partial [Myxococcales bacterium]|nr:hypothetical protein [Myxococcales bacterium]
MFRIELSSVGKPWRVLAAVSVVACATLGCGSDDSSSTNAPGDEPKATYGPPSKQTVSKFQRANPDGTNRDVESHVVGEKTIGGTSLWRTRIGDFSGAAPSGSEAWIVQPNADTLLFGGGEIYSQDILPSPDPTQPSASVELSTPLKIDLAGTVGQAVPVTVDTTLRVLGQDVPVKISATITLESANETLTTLAGVLHGTRKFVGTGSADNPALKTLIGGDSLNAAVWYHPGLGMVRATVTLPNKGDFDFDFIGTSEYGNATSGTNRIQAMAVLNTLESLNLDTYDVNGQFDADKQTHAKMMIEARFLDEAKAASSNLSA